MIRKKIHVELNPHGCVGTRATVQTRLFFIRRRRQFICHHSGILMGGQWVDAESGVAASDSLQHELNVAAQAAARLYLHTQSS